MPPYLNDFFRQADPAYKDGYENGFRIGKQSAERILKEALKEVRALEAFSTSTATTSI